MSLIGDTQKKAEQPMVAALPLAVVKQADVGNKDNAVNKALYSGKKLGATYCMKNTTGTGYDIVVAVGSAPTSGWARISDGTLITPA